MADYCEYWGAVKGEAYRCRAFMGALPKADMLSFRVIESEPVAIFAFKGQAKGPMWPTFESFLDDEERERYPVDVPGDEDEAYAFGEQYMGETPIDLSVRFGVSFVVNDDWENYHAYDDKGNWAGLTELAEELEGCSVDSESNAGVPDYMQKLDIKLLGNCANAFGLCGPTDLYDDMGISSAEELLWWLEDRGEIELKSRVEKVLSGE